MQLIAKDGTVKQACDRCHRVRVKFSRGTICDPCREFDRQVSAHARQFFAEARALQIEMERARNAG